MAVDLCCCSCGGALDVKNAKGTTIVCDYCGKEQVIPSLDNEARLKAYRRATEFRLKKQFDEAQRIYESMLLQFSDDFEVRWGLCLCRYGVEYIEDFDGKRIPICHRNLYESILLDDDYLFAIDNCDSVAKATIEHDAKYIDSVQKRYIEISKQETPYDVFISYKETETYSNNRTKDSVLAEEIYDQLEKEHFKVFFARISLSEKLGQDFEPNIEFALSTAKVMLLVGTSVENINSVWVKSEWSRYLKFMVRDRGKKSLIPCYLGFDPYDLPNEISSFQAQDLSKIGAIKDIVKGIKKLVEPSTVVTVAQGGETAARLIRRAEIHIERNEKKQAIKILDQCLNLDPENATAYLLLALINYGIDNIVDLDNYCKRTPNYKEIYDERITQKLYNNNTNNYEPFEIIPKNEYVFLDIANSDYTSDEMDLLHNKSGFVNLMTIDDSIANEYFSYALIDENINYKTAQKFAKDELKSIMDKHFEAHKQTHDAHVQKCKNEYNQFVKERYEALKKFYYDATYNATKAISAESPKEAILSFLKIDNYLDSHALAFSLAHGYVSSGYNKDGLYDFVVHNFWGEEQKTLLTIYKNSWMANKERIVKQLQEVETKASKSKSIKLKESTQDDINNELNALSMQKNDLKQTARYYKTNSYANDIAEIDSAFAKADKQVDKLNKYAAVLPKRKDPVGVSSFFAVLIPLLLVIIMFAAAKGILYSMATNYAESEDWSFWTHYLEIMIPLAPTFFAVVIIISLYMSIVNSTMAPFGLGLLVGLFGGPILSFILFFTAPVFGSPVIITRDLTLLLVTILCFAPFILSLIVGFIKHRLRPATIMWYITEIFLLALAIIVFVLMKKYMIDVFDFESYPEPNEIFSLYW